MPEHPLQLDDAHALGGNRHHHAGEARLGLAHLERIHRAALGSELLGQVVEPIGPADLDRVGSELGAEHRVHHKPLDQLADLRGLLVSG